MCEYHGIIRQSTRVCSLCGTNIFRSRLTKENKDLCSRKNNRIIPAAFIGQITRIKSDFYIIMKQVLFFAPVVLLAGTLVFCKNTPAASDANTPLPAERNDSLYGIKGCDRAGFHPITKTEREFLYQDFTVHVKDNPDGKGQEIRIVRTDTTTADMTITHEEPTYFRGVSRGQILLEEGTGPENRKLVVYHIKRRALMFRMAFAGDMEVSANGNVRFYTPTEESEVTKIPECPDKAKWEGEGLKVVYGQLCLFNLVQRSLTRKSEYICIPLK